MSQRVVRPACPAAENGHGEEQTVFWGCDAARGCTPSVYALILMGGWSAAQRIQPFENQVRQTISTTGNASQRDELLTEATRAIDNKRLMGAPTVAPAMLG